MQWRCLSFFAFYLLIYFKYHGCPPLHLLEARYLWIPHLPGASSVLTVLRKSTEELAKTLRLCYLRCHIPNHGKIGTWLLTFSIEMGPGNEVIFVDGVLSQD